MEGSSTAPPVRRTVIPQLRFLPFLSQIKPQTTARYDNVDPVN